MSESDIKRLEKKIDAISEFLEDIYLTKEEEERIKESDRVVRGGRLKDLTRVV